MNNVTNDYKCKYNIQLKKHSQNKHKSTAAYNCNACNFSTEFVDSVWEHTAADHPDHAPELTQLQRKNFILTIVAEQTTHLTDDVDSLRNDTKNAFSELAITLETCFNNMKEESSDKCKILGNSVVKLYNKMNRIEKALGQSKPINEEKKKQNRSNPAKVVNIKSKKKQTKSVPKSFSPPPPTKPSSPPPQDAPKAPPPNPPHVSQGKPKVLCVGDSVGHTANLRLVEKSGKCVIRSARAYSSTNDNTARWPERNFQDVVHKNLANPGRHEYDILVMSAPTVDITNLFPNSSSDYLEQKVINSCKNMLNTAQQALTQYKNLKRAVIMEHPPRFDDNVKSRLASLPNSTMRQLWDISPLKDKIYIGFHSLECYGVGSTHMAR